jgi:hypothetical protein
MIMKRLLVCAFLALGVCTVTTPLVAADPLGSATLTTDTGSAAPVATPTPASTGSAVAQTPADKLPNPGDDPAKALDAEKAAYKLGWPLAVLAALVMLAKLAGTAATISWLAWLGKGKAAAIAAGVGAVSAAAFNALALGGTWYAALIAAGGVVLLLIKPHAEPKPAAT